jgi:hypothetical protein
MWRYVGHQEQLRFTLDVITRPGARLRFLRPTLSPSEVKPKDCNAKIYRRPKCPRY